MEGDHPAPDPARREQQQPGSQAGQQAEPQPEPRPELQQHTIVLIGLMGAGKTAVGRRLATRLGLSFVDADQEIEAAAGCSIADIFAMHGEQAFRDGERRVISRLLDDPPHVLATGGGAWMDPETRAKVAERSLSVWLRADFEVLLRRTARRSHRPLLRGRNHGEVLRKLQEERYPVYALADIVVDTEDCPLDTTVGRVLQAIERYREPE
ncbi:MAG: shikimate kinase [Alphaproteobacteria bacterium]